MITTPSLGLITSAAARSKGARKWNRSVVILIFAAVLFPVSYTVADPDIWGHVRFGQDILALGRIPTTDSYSYTSGARPWINHELLAEIAFGWIFNQFGAVGLIVLKTLIVMLTLILVFWYACRKGLEALPAGILMVMTATLVLPDAIMVRPHIFTYLFYAVTMVVVNEADAGRLRLLWVLPFLFALWINTHGGVLAGVAMLIVWSGVRVLLPAVVQRRAALLKTRAAVTIYTVLGASLVALLINPYGHQLVWFLVRTGTVPRPEITEWNAVRLLSFEGAGYAAFLVAMTVAIITGRHQLSMPIVALFVVTGALPLLAQRHLPLFGLTFALLGAESVAAAWRRWTRIHGANATAIVSPWPTRIVGLSGAILLLCCVPHFRGILVDTKRFPMPVRAVEMIQRSGVGGNLAVLFDWGEYVIWHVGPRVQVSVDGRRETVYDATSYRRNLDFMRGTGRWDALLTEYPTNMALVRRHSASANLLLQRTDWELLYQDQLCALFAKRGRAAARALRRVAPPAVSPYGKGLKFPVALTTRPVGQHARKQPAAGFAAR